MKKFWEDFKKFISRGNVVDMAVGVAVAGAFTKIVTAFNTGFIGPLIALLTGSSSFSTMKWVIREANVLEDGTEIAEVAIMYGDLIQTTLDFVMIALTLFIVMRTWARLSERAKRLSTNVKELLTPENEAEIKRLEEEKAAAEALEKAAEEARIAEEKAALEKAALEKKEAEKARLLSSVELLEEIRDLLKNKE